MNLKKLLCLLLALLMVFSLAACGDNGSGDNDEEDDDDSVHQDDDQDPTSGTTQEPEDDTVWVLVQESDMGSSRYTKYIYDENGVLVAGEFYRDSEKWGDYQYTTTATASGGKIVEEFYKHVEDSEFVKHNDYEYDAAGRLIRVVDYDIFEDAPSGYVYTFTYNEAGQLVEQVATSDGEMQEQMTFVYDGDKLMEGHYYDHRGSESFGHYLYTYDAEGNPVKVDVHTDSMDYESEYTLEFEITDLDWYVIEATSDCHYVVGGRKLFYYEKLLEDGEPYEMNIQIKSWGIFHTGWLPLVSFGCMNPSNYFLGTAELTYMPLEVHLAQQTAK